MFVTEYSGIAQWLFSGCSAMPHNISLHSPVSPLNAFR
ncbi:hypothetical protein PRUB_a3513 [Pseudoalteromonas rubra]|uniref:Uncharacterized protein n=1 Tax=Pseudoalteromonas rubra TaxID=43658 RepID=A0A8T0C302_9GAMM|nr:hypothetical protein PRUB_a3513 [Pseudoalteromonas rubra]